MSTCIRQTAASRPNFFSVLFSYFVAQYVLIIVVWFFLWKCILVFEKWVLSFDRSNMQIFTLNITRVVWPHVTNLLDLRYFCQHNPLLYHLNLIPCHYWSWQRIIYFLVNIFVRHTFSLSKSSICNATSIFTITLPKIPTSEWFKWTLNFLAIFGEYFCPTYFFYVEK